MRPKGTNLSLERFASQLDVQILRTKSIVWIGMVGCILVLLVPMIFSAQEAYRYRSVMNTSCPSYTKYYLIKTISKWALSSVQLTVGSTEGATERNKPFPRKVCITACCAIFRTKHCVNRNGGMHSCAARQEGNYTLTQSSDSHSWSSAHKKHTGTVPSWTQAVRPTQNTI